MKLFPLLALVFSLLLPTSRLSSQTLNWAKQLTCFQNLVPLDMIVDDTGHVYVCGYFSSTADFDPSNGQFEVSSNAFSQDVFLAKYDSLGQFVWARTFGGTQNEEGRSLSFDHVGNILLVGLFEGSSDFDPDTSTTSDIVSSGMQDVFISKFDPNGSWLFTKTIGGSFDENVIGITSDSNGNMYISGAFTSSVDMDPNLGVNTISTGSDRNVDAFLLSLSNIGIFRWVKQYQYSNFQDAYDITVKVRVDAQNDIVSISSLGSSRAIRISKHTTSGNLVWEKEIETSIGTIYSDDLKLDRNDDIIICGYFNRRTDFDASSDSSYLDGTFSNKRNGFLLKYDQDGNFKWVNSMVPANPVNSFPFNIFPSAIAIDHKNNIHLIGNFRDGIDFDPSSDTVILTSKGGSDDIFLAGYASNSSFLYAQQYGFSGNSDAGLAVETFKNNIITSGYFSGNVDFDPDPNNALTLTARGASLDGYIQSLNYCPPSFASLTVTNCNGYRFPSGKTIFQSGVYNDTIISIDGCDSIITFDVTIIPVDTSVTLFGLQYISNANSPNTFYQWVDCNDNYSSIPGATSRTFEPVRTVGAYAVVVLENNCTDTSRCYGAAVGIEDQLFSSKVSIAPNPTNGFVSISLGDFYQEVNIEITNAVGQIIEEKTLLSIDQFQIELKGSKGIYLLKVTTDKGESATIRVVKE